MYFNFQEWTNLVDTNYICTSDSKCLDIPC